MSAVVARRMISIHAKAVGISGLNFGPVADRESFEFCRNLKTRVVVEYNGRHYLIDFRLGTIGH